MFKKSFYELVIILIVVLSLPNLSIAYNFDLVRDGYIDFADIRLFADRWLDNNCFPDNCGGADFNGQNGVDFADFAMFAANWHQPGAVPKVVGETNVPLPITENIPAVWQSSGDLTLLKSGTTWMGQDVLEINYRVQSGSASIIYTLPSNHLASERLRFWLKGDSSGNTLSISCYLSSDLAWLPQTDIVLNFNGWRHFEIPASNPIYLYYNTVTQFRFVLGGPSSSSQRQLLMSNMELVSPELIKAPLPYKDIPSPAFDTWGGPSQDQIIASVPVGTTIHIAPINFFGWGSTVAERCGYATQAVKWVNDAGLTPAIQFYNYPGDWMDTHLDMMVKNQDGQYQIGDGGAFTSPWNPNARALWRQHIIDSLNYMKANNRLQYVKVVQISPGVEGEVSYEWGNVWAFDDYAIAAYRDYLRTLYNNDITQLNVDWNSSHTSFDNLIPPGEWYPDRAHWVFTDFYRLSMLENYIFMANAVKEVFTPDYWLCMVHTIPSYPMRFYSARYSLFYAENMARLGTLDYAQIAALDWQHKEDVNYLQSKGLTVIGEKDIVPTEESLIWTFNQAKKYGMDGVFVGIMEPLSSGGQLTSLGIRCQQLIQDFINPPPTSSTVLENFADVSEWVVWSGAGAGSPTIATDGNVGSLNYDHPAVQGFDYTQFGLYYPVAADWSAYTGMVLKGITMPADPDIEFSVRIHSGSWAYLMEYQFTFPLVGTGLDGTGVAPNNFVDYSEGDFDMSHIDFFSLRTVGDATPNAASGSITIDDIVLVSY